MNRILWVVGIRVIAALWFPIGAFAQQTGAIAGGVRDSSGAVLPGVTVEASSPALIEKVRSATTDGNGAYRITDLQPGVYTTTFSLAGFSTVKREGIELTCLLNNIHDTQEQLFLDFEKIVPVIAKHVGEDVHVKRGGTQTHKSDTHGRRIDTGVPA